jgi:antitoxin component of MazEF toxin-antitoxin module
MKTTRKNPYLKDGEKMLTVRVPAELVATLDLARGKNPRSELVRLILVDAVRRFGQDVAHELRTRRALIDSGRVRYGAGARKTGRMNG